LKLEELQKFEAKHEYESCKLISLDGFRMTAMNASALVAASMW
jgi:hypothetical protein